MEPGEMAGLSVRELVAALSQVEDDRHRLRRHGPPAGLPPGEAGAPALARRERLIVAELRRRARARLRGQDRGRAARR